MFKEVLTEVKPEEKPEEEKEKAEGEPKEDEAEAEVEKQKPVLESKMVPVPPLITKEALYDFQITQVRIFPNSTRLLQVAEEPEYVF